jgi:hypothetical protein
MFVNFNMNFNYIRNDAFFEIALECVYSRKQD